MNKGVIISGIGHVGLILWAMFGGWLFAAREVPKITVTDVQIISSAEFDAQFSSAPSVDALAPEPVAQPADALEPAPQPEVQPEPTPAPEPAPRPEAAPQPEAAPAPQPDPPQAEPVAEPLPEAPTPQPDPVPQPVAPPADVPQPIPQPRADKRPKPRPVTKLSDTPVDDAPETPRIADEPTPEVTDTPSAEAQPEPPKPEAQPEVAAPEITPDAPEPTDDAPQLAMTSSKRPQSRPKAPAKPAETAAPSGGGGTADEQAAIDAAVEAAAAAAAKGPPMSAGEIGDAQAAINKCWNVGAISTEAQNMKVTLRVEMSPDGKPASITMSGFEGGSEAAARQAFETARRAVIRSVQGCGAAGLALDPEKYATWSVMNLNFDARGVRF